MIRIENSQPVVPATKLEAVTSSQRFDLHAKSSIGGTESKGCIAAIWQGIKNVFNFLFGWIFRCCGAEKAQTFEPTAEFKAFYDDYMQAYYPHLDIEYFKDFDTRKDLYMRALHGEFYPAQESKVRALAQWLKDEQELFVTSEEEKQEFGKHLEELCKRFLENPKLEDQSAEDLLKMLLEDPLNEKILSDEEIEKGRERIEQLIEDKSDLLGNPHIGNGFSNDGLDLITQWFSNRDHTLYTKQDVYNEIADEIEKGNESILKEYEFSNEVSRNNCIIELRSGKREQKSEDFKAYQGLWNFGYKCIGIKETNERSVEEEKGDLMIPIFSIGEARKNALCIVTFDSEEGIDQFAKVSVDQLKEKK